ncbi:MAG TPA: transglutaminase family protein [Polyangiaceae bacterium]|nr:transglutaminase family protein [Polyangiaceae bacterium]
MAIRVALQHITEYAFDRPVEFSPHVVRLRPAAHSRTAIESYSLLVTPEDHFINWQQDPFGNYLARFVFQQPTDMLRFEVNLVADLVTINPFDFFLEESAEKYPFAYDAALKRELSPYLETTQTGPAFRSLVGAVRDNIARPERRIVDVLVDINRLIQRSLRYDVRMEPGVFTPDETLERQHGSCRDFAWLLCNVLRELGIAARFVSGYSIQLVPDQKPLEGPAGVSQDIVDLHAWAEAFLPGAGWVGLDATSGLLCGEGHIPLACTAEPGSAAPVTGGFSWDKRGEDDELGQKFKYEMKVTRLEDRPRPSRSYSEEQWRALVACGHAVDEVLKTSDVRLTMGGEPTFVSVDDMEGEEWNTAALGWNKERIGDDLLRRLRRRFSVGGLLHHGQGKWYPGESLPRWAYSCYFRKDRQPLWHSEELIAHEDKGHGPEQARELMRALTTRLGLDTGLAIPGFEDTWYYLWRERRLPTNVDPFESHLEEEEERARLRKVFSNGLKHVVGYALPLRAETSLNGDISWESGRWFLREERLYLLPGDSPMGYRLPLDSLPWASQEERGQVIERDPFAPRPELRRGERVVQRPRARELSNAPVRGLSTPDVVRTALCVEARGGMLHVFMPPLGELEEYLELVTVLENCAGELGYPLRIEGYLPPRDPRLQLIQVTPDPGVIEVNIHPAENFGEVVDNTSVLYEEARLARLGTNKFMLDGRHSGTGGGNHVTIGGATADDSPLLRRPDLLRSIVSYWNNHPALSYLFSGLFIGPTSQAPRIDEARHDSLYELDLAFSALERSSQPAPPWLVDRLFRNLLIDVSGNTHRAELCMDKLYNPDAASGRQGILELRAFEMPPDARMSIAQQLLVRSLVAMFWREPYKKPLVRWGSGLHDRFMLPHFVWEDICDVAGDLGRAGLGVESEWFRPHWEFRFPRYGKVAAGGLELELRQAAEPWHVLGEQGGQGGTARYVDSSVERVELVVRGLTETRQRVLCNGAELPMHPTGRSGEAVAGVRYKAWKPPNALHPTHLVDTPLVFDVFDTWSRRAVGGCTYHVAHPGGRSYDVYPKNSLEAESRRVGRFFPFGGSLPENAADAPAHRTRELPLTLDLRR